MKKIDEELIRGGCSHTSEELHYNWCHSIQITFYHSFAIKLFSFAGLPGL